MKKALFCAALALISLSACRNDTTSATTIQEVGDLATQNTNDDLAIKKYMDEHYLDSQGNIRAFSSTSTEDDQYAKLSDLNPQTLPSGVVVIVREGAQPNPGKEIGSTDVLRLMHYTNTFLSQNDSDGVKYTSEFTFANTMTSTGSPVVDPAFYYVKNTVMATSGYGRSYYEIEGFQEGLKYFKSFEQDDQTNYNLQGVIIVPSRAAFARDSHYLYAGYSWRNRTFVFNFQVYKSTTRSAEEQ
ncbi:hypothetical protein [Bergeyella sp. RCAD1439]|uniref:hypothetical protein n=1 Tax=Bergeyella anatis TaxID=3113737 RepID=UPI002E185AA4|nr:hypothetical protein [Bergeyella sp. RCAD1439]